MALSHIAKDRRQLKILSMAASILALSCSMDGITKVKDLFPQNETYWVYGVRSIFYQRICISWVMKSV